MHRHRSVVIYLCARSTRVIKINRPKRCYVAKFYYICNYKSSDFGAMKNFWAIYHSESDLLMKAEVSLHVVYTPPL